MDHVRPMHDLLTGNEGLPVAILNRINVKDLSLQLWAGTARQPSTLDGV